MKPHDDEMLSIFIGYDPKEAIAYMYGEDTLERLEMERKGITYYSFGDAWVGLYKTFYNVTPEEVKVLSKFWVI